MQVYQACLLSFHRKTVKGSLRLIRWWGLGVDNRTISSSMPDSKRRIEGLPAEIIIGKIRACNKRNPGLFDAFFIQCIHLMVFSLGKQDLFREGTT